MQKTYRPAYMHAVGVNGTLAAGVDRCIRAEQATPDPGLAQPDRCSLLRAGARLMRATHLRTRQIKSTADPYPVPQQARKAVTSRECQLMKLRALHHRRCFELTVVEPQGERHLQPGQVQRPGDHRALQSHTARIDLIPELDTAAAQQPGIHRAARAARPAVKNLPLRPFPQRLGQGDLFHDVLPNLSRATSLSGTYRPATAP